MQEIDRNLTAHKLVLCAVVCLSEGILRKAAIICKYF